MSCGWRKTWKQGQKDGDRPVQAFRDAFRDLTSFRNQHTLDIEAQGKEEMTITVWRGLLSPGPCREAQDQRGHRTESWLREQNSCHRDVSAEEWYLYLIPVWLFWGPSFVTCFAWPFYLLIYLLFLFFCWSWFICLSVLVVQLCPTLCNPIDCRLRVSVHGILQARILEWIAIPFSRGSSQPRDHIRVSCIGRQILYHWATREAYYNSAKMISHAVISLGSHAVSFQRAHQPGCKEGPSSLLQNILFL